MNSTITKHTTAPAVIAGDKIAAIVAMLLGSVFIFFIGFSNIEVVHNAGHDTRHSSAFPCH